MFHLHVNNFLAAPIPVRRPPLRRAGRRGVGDRRLRRTLELLRFRGRRSGGRSGRPGGGSPARFGGKKTVEKTGGKKSRNQKIKKNEFMWL